MDIITIQPADKEVKLMLDYVKIINEFRLKGFNTRGAFVNIVHDYLPELQNYKYTQRLTAYWNGRVRDAELNAKLQTVLNKLSHE